MDNNVTEQVQIDSDVQAVLEFMQEHIPADRLVGVAEHLPEMARLLWGHNGQEHIRPMSLNYQLCSDAQPPSAK